MGHNRINLRIRRCDIGSVLWGICIRNSSLLWCYCLTATHHPDKQTYYRKYSNILHLTLWLLNNELNYDNSEETWRTTQAENYSVMAKSDISNNLSSEITQPKKPVLTVHCHLLPNTACVANNLGETVHLHLRLDLSSTVAEVSTDTHGTSAWSHLAQSHFLIGPHKLINKRRGHPANIRPS